MITQNHVDRPQRIVAEIISIGDEIATGHILDTNAPFLSRSLAEIGVKVLYQTTISDDMDAMVEAFATAFRRADVVVCTGGLGPTKDDLTRQAAAKTLGTELEFDPESFEHTSALFKRRGREMPDSNRIQAFFPKGSRVVKNPNGTAPGFIVEQKRSLLPDVHVRYGSVASGNALKGEFIFLTFPGVPAELYEMWDGPEGRASIEKFVTRIQGGQRAFYKTRFINLFGLGESAVEARLPGLIDRDHFPTVGITAKNSVITLRIFAEGHSEGECDRQIEEISQEIYTKTGDFIFGENSETLPMALGFNLRPQCRRVGVFEWGTRGVLASVLDSDVLGFGRVFGEHERNLFTRLFGSASDVPESKRKARHKNESFSYAYYVDNLPVSEELQKYFHDECRDQTVDYLLAVGPYPEKQEDDKSSTPKTVDVVFVDFRDPALPVMRRDTFAFGGQPAVIDALFSNRAMDILLRNQ